MYVCLIQWAKYITDLGRVGHFGARSSGRLNFVPSRLILWGSAYGNSLSVNVLALRILRQLLNFFKNVSIPGQNAFENRVFKRMLWSQRAEMRGKWEELHIEEIHNLYSSTNIIRVIKLIWKRPETWGPCGTGCTGGSGEKPERWRLLTIT